MQKAPPMRSQAPATAFRPSPALLRIERCLGPTHRNNLATDVVDGLSRAQKSLPSKYFYDQRGSEIFDAICDLPEYYVTRADTRLLIEHADALIELAQPTDIIELGSGAARKSRIILDACVRAGRTVRYVPMDVSEAHLRQTAQTLQREYPGLPIHGIAGDYDRHLDRIPDGERRLVLFLGSTIGNFPPVEAERFVQRIAERLAPGDTILIGMDLVKPVDVLHAAYNDSAGLTAEFNRNVLRVVNRDLGAEFVPEDFEHVAFFNQEASQIEMHLRASRDHSVRIRDLGLDVPFAAGETIHTEISRKFRRADAELLYGAAGCRLERWWTDADGYFAEAVGLKM